MRLLSKKVDDIFDLTYAHVTGGITGAEERRNCDMYIGYNLQRDEYLKRYPGVENWPEKLDMTCLASPAAKKPSTTCLKS